MNSLVTSTGEAEGTVKNFKCFWQKLGTSCVCVCWFPGHAEQLLLSCLCSKVTYMSNVKCKMQNIKCLKDRQVLGTINVWMFWTTFVFMSMLKSDIYVKCQVSTVKCCQVFRNVHSLSAVFPETTGNNDKRKTTRLIETWLSLSKSCRSKLHKQKIVLKKLLPKILRPWLQN